MIKHTKNDLKNILFILSLLLYIFVLYRTMQDTKIVQKLFYYFVVLVFFFFFFDNVFIFI